MLSWPSESTWLTMHMMQSYYFRLIPNDAMWRGEAHGCHRSCDTFFAVR